MRADKRGAEPNAGAGSKPAAEADEERFELGGFYLDCPHPDRGGIYYACRYDERTRIVRRRSLRTADREEAKVKLAALVLSAPAASGAAIPGPDQVLTVAALANYVQGHATTIRSESDAVRAGELAKEYIETHVKQPLAPVSFWTPSRQLDFAKYLRTTYGHSPASIERRLDVVCAAFNEMTEVKLRLDPFGQEVETALMTHAPKFVYKRDRIASELKIPPSKPRHNKHSIEDVAKILDAIEHEHVFRFAIMSLTTWGRPEAVADFRPDLQRANGLIDLNPPGRVQTNKRRPLILETQCLGGWLDAWGKVDQEARARALAEENEPADDWLMTFHGKRVVSVKKGVTKAASEAKVGKFSPGKFRHFMATTVRRLCRGVTREQRSIWMGHTVKEGSRTTDNYEAFDPEYLADVSLAIDYVMQQMQRHCRRKLFAIEVRLNRADLRRIGAQPWEKAPELQVVVGGR